LSIFCSVLQNLDPTRGLKRLISCVSGLAIPPKPYALFRSTIHALLIGIDHYKHAGKTLPSLKGAVADMKLVLDFLKCDLGVRDSFIKALKNENATRRAIVDAITDMTASDNIKNGEAIFIYFAGHGCSLGEIQAIVPYDAPARDTDLKNLISDKKLASLLYSLAAAKGNNIVCIYSDEIFSVFNDA